MKKKNSFCFTKRRVKFKNKKSIFSNNNLSVNHCDLCIPTIPPGRMSDKLYDALSDDRVCLDCFQRASRPEGVFNSTTGMKTNSYYDFSSYPIFSKRKKINHHSRIKCICKEILKKNKESKYGDAGDE